MRIEDEIKLTFDDVLIRPKRSTLVSRSEVQLDRDFKFRHTSLTWSGVPIVSANMDTTGTFETAISLQKHKMITAVHKFYTVEDWKQSIDKLDPNFIAVTVGQSDEDMQLAKDIFKLNDNIKFLCIDVANGYREDFINAVKRYRETFKDKIIIAGNVATREMTEALILAGADIVKIGIGPGSVCTTRSVAGVGYPQLSSISECSDAAHGLGGHVMADGGCKFPGDVSKAFGAGADFVMLGGMLAGHDESEGEIVNGTVQFYGMSSDAAMAKHGSRKDGYRGAEGKVVEIPHRGPVAGTVTEILGGVRSACTYIGARRLKDMPKCTTFVRVNNQVNQVFNQYNK